MWAGDALGGKYLLKHVKECAYHAHTCQTEMVTVVFTWEGMQAQTHTYKNQNIYIYNTEQMRYNILQQTVYFY